MATLTAEQVAQRFHEHYERLAPEYGYETREASAVPWGDVPEPNRSLMVAVAAAVLDDLRQPQQHGSIDALVQKTAERQREHVLRPDCWCQPTVERFPGPDAG